MECSLTKNIGDKVVNKMNNVIYCTICGASFSSHKALSMHIVKSKEEQHQKLTTIKKENKFDIHQLLHYIEQSPNTLSQTNELKDVKSVVEVVSKKETDIKADKYMEVPCVCTMSCKDCHIDWKKDYFDGCQLPRKKAFVEEYGIKDEQIKSEVKKVEKVKKEKIEKVKVAKVKKEQKEIEFDELPSKKEDNCKDLLKYFYGLVGGESYDFAREAKQIKSALDNKRLNIDVDVLKQVFEYMHMRGQVNLKFLTSTAISDYRIYSQIISELQKEGSAAYLLKIYYDGFE
jgi:hypothetical protein